VLQRLLRMAPDFAPAQEKMQEIEAFKARPVAPE
jgi:hypothetical protein